MRPRAQATQASPTDPARPPAADGDSIRALGLALGLRAEECIELCARRTAAYRWEGAEPSPEYIEKVRGINWLATVLVARWLAFRIPVSEDEMRCISERGSMAASEQQSSVNLTRAYLVWRDTVLEILRDEALRLGSSREALSEAQRIVRVSADASLIQVARAFDARMAGLSQDLAQEREMLRHLALHDQLTGLPNRLLLHDRVEQAVHAARRSGSSFAVLAIDLNGFKEINDSLGHQSGDLVLQQVSARLVAAVRESDTVARWGGDEFTLLLPGATLESAHSMARELRTATAEPMVVAGSTVSVGATIGVALYPTAGADVQDLLAAADSDLYRLKRERAA